MFKAFGLKIYAILGAIIATLLMIVGYRGRKIDYLQHDAKINDRIKKNHEQQEIDEKEVLKNEQEEIEKDAISIDSRSRRDQFNEL